MTTPHECLHEEQIQGQSRAIERIGAELNYKKERLDDLKEDNKIMQQKLDEIKDCVNQLIVKSKTDDDNLEKRLVAIETEQKVIKEQTDKQMKLQQSDFNKKIAIISTIFGLITVTLAILTFFK